MIKFGAVFDDGFFCEDTQGFLEIHFTNFSKKILIELWKK
jgi:hypothetical protein